MQGNISEMSSGEDARNTTVVLALPHLRSTTMKQLFNKCMGRQRSNNFRQWIGEDCRLMHRFHSGGWQKLWVGNDVLILSHDAFCYLSLW